MGARLRASAICRCNDRLLVVELRDPVTEVRAMFPPGGKVETNEDPSATAARETREETGLRVRVDAASAIVERYPYRWAGEDVDVTTHFFWAELDEPFVEAIPPVADAPYVLGAFWLPPSEALEAMPRIVAAPVATMIREKNHASWRAHPHITGPAGTLLSIHGQFRAASRRLVALLAEADTKDLPHFARAFAPLGETLHHHHRAEEAMLFPALGAPQRLVDDHGTLTRAIAAMDESLGRDVVEARRAAAELDHVLVTHLDREEETVVPQLLSMSPHQAWALIHG